MTTKIKIIVGFVAMMVLIANTAAIGYYSTVVFSDGFGEFRRLARINVNISDVEANLHRAVGRVNDFLMQKDASSITDAKAGVDTALTQLDSSVELAVKGATKESLTALKQEIGKMHSLIADVQTSVKDTDDFYASEVLPAAEGLQLAISQFTQASARAQDVPGLVLIADSLNRYALVRAAVARYYGSRLEADARLGRENLDVMKKSLQAIQANVVSERGQQLMNAMLKACDRYDKSFDVLVRKCVHVSNAFASMEEIAKLSLKTTEAMNSERDARMRDSGAAMAERSDTVKAEMFMVGGAGFLIGLVIAIYIVIGLVAVLKRLSSFAVEVAQGNFKASIDIKEKGEIGDVVTAVRSIPMVISEVVAGAKTMSHDIVVGKFRSRMNRANYSGGFGELADTVNVVADSFTNVLDIIPISIKTGDRKKSIRFLNTEAQNLLGGDFVNQRCGELMRSDVCDTSNCFGEQCLQRNAHFVGEGMAHPQDQAKDFSFIAIPLKDDQGKIEGYIEIINDISEIKEKQNVIVRVANQASEIADRVAAASEEIAAQVEQISRGAEIQRERVESTASAMTEMNSTVLEVARSAGEAADQSGVTKEKAEHGANLVHDVISSIAMVNTVAQSMQKDMQDLGQLAENVGGVMNVISDVADQTNLLALNAAIEAARAGEAGRGFAVVADEVRKLAEKSMQATQEVGSNIAAIQTAVRKNIGSMGDAAKGVASATGLASSSGDALSEIVELASDSSAVVSSIAAAAEEQSATSEEINRSIDEINRIVGETTQGMLQSSQAVQELSRMTQELRRIIDSLR